jgi:DNA-binding transcriptional LysR family regulator
LRDRLDGVAVFVTVVEAGSFSSAAQVLALSRSAVAKSIGRLEERLDTRLFHRTTRSLALTYDGQTFFARCARALNEIREGEKELATRRKAPGGRLKVTMPVLFGRRHIEPILIELAREHSALELDMRFSDSHVDIISEGFDLAIRIGQSGNVAGLRARKIATLRMLFCAAPSYLANRPPPIEVQDLEQHEALIFRLNGQPLAWPVLERSGQPYDPVLKARLQFDNFESMVNAAVQGLGIACLPDWLAEPAIADQSLVQLLADHPVETRDVYAIWPESPAMSASLRLAIDRLATLLPRALAYGTRTRGFAG